MNVSPYSLRALLPLLILGLAGCGETGVLESGNPFEIDFEVMPTEATVGEEIEFFVEVTGASLQSVTLRFGDGEEESEEFQGSILAGMDRTHTYEEPGTYTASVEAQEFTGEFKREEVEILITEAD